MKVFSIGEPGRTVDPDGEQVLAHITGVDEDTDVIYVERVNDQVGPSWDVFNTWFIPLRFIPLADQTVEELETPQPFNAHRNVKEYEDAALVLVDAAAEMRR